MGKRAYELTVATYTGKLALLKVSQAPPYFHTQMLLIKLLRVLYILNTHIKYQDPPLVLLCPGLVCAVVTRHPACAACEKMHEELQAPRTHVDFLFEAGQGLG